MRLALVTCRKMTQPADDERLLMDRGPEHGFEMVRTVWDDPEVDWTSFDGALIRSIWDYHQKIDAFRAWLDRIEVAGLPLLNTAPLVRWNMDKRYLLELAQGGVPIPPACRITASNCGDLDALLDDIPGDTLVVKPTVSATAWKTRKVAREDRAAIHQAVDDILPESDALVQRFQPEIYDGEWSLLYFDGKFSHAVVKRPKSGDFRVQSDFGGSYTAETPEPRLVTDATRALEAAPSMPLYARVDGVVADGRFLLMELELIEPDLMLGYAPGSTDRLLESLQERL